MKRQNWMTLTIAVMLALMVATTPIFAQEETTTDTQTTTETTNYSTGITLIFLILGMTGVAAVGGLNWFTEISERKSKKSS